jgi:hypothetical protein
MVIKMQPYPCPVCGGKGTVLAGFYDYYISNPTNTSPERCRTCDGTGIVWGEPNKE